VTEDGGLEVPLIDAQAHEQTKQPAQEPVPEGPEHPGSGLQAGLPANGLIRAPIEFLYPTGPGHVAQALLAPAECIEVRPHSRAFTFGAQAEITPT
jgi:hypothetical protein